jgi:hypothetical protein
MAATRVRVLFEFRNGNGNFLSLDMGGEYIPCKGEFDLDSLDAAYLSALQKHGIKQTTLREHLQGLKAPSHD